MEHIDIRPLKQFANKLPPNSRVKTLLLYEKDEMSAAEFLAKVEVWLYLFRIETETPYGQPIQNRRFS